MKFHPILFSTEMVKAILPKIKTQTRRTNNLDKVNVNPNDWEFVRFWNGHAKFTEKHNAINEIYIKCPYGEVGDVLWVREEHYSFGIWEKNGFTKACRRKWKFRRTGRVYYNDNQPENFKYYKSLAARRIDDKEPDHPSFYKRLARFMPKKFCRIFLEIKSIRVERLQDISAEDCFEEGVGSNFRSGAKNFHSATIDQEAWINKQVRLFAALWQKINGAESWNANPWVWVVEFEQVNKPSNFLV